MAVGLVFKLKNNPLFYGLISLCLAEPGRRVRGVVEFGIFAKWALFPEFILPLEGFPLLILPWEALPRWAFLPGLPLWIFPFDSLFLWGFGITNVLYLKLTVFNKRTKIIFIKV